MSGENSKTVQFQTSSGVQQGKNSNLFNLFLDNALLCVYIPRFEEIDLEYLNIPYSIPNESTFQRLVYWWLGAYSGNLVQTLDQFLMIWTSWTDWMKIKRIDIMTSVLLFFYATKMIHFSIALCHLMRNGYGNQRSSRTRKETPKHFPKPTFDQKKVIVSVWWIEAGLIHYHFLDPAETITAEKYCQEISQIAWEIAVYVSSTSQQNNILIRHIKVTIFNWM